MKLKRTKSISLAASIASVLAIGGAGPKGQAPEVADGEGRPHVALSLVGETTSLTPGTTAYLAARFEIEPGWHTYWEGLNDTGMPPKLGVSVPPGFEAGAWELPAPHRHVSPGDLLDHVYEGTVLFLVPVSVPADARGEATFTLTASWLVCAQACVPEQGTASLTLPVAQAGGAPAKSKDAGAFEQSRALMPASPPNQTVLIDVHPTEPEVRVRVENATRLEFYPAGSCATLENALRDGSRKGSSLVLRLDAAELKRATAPRLSGILRVDAPATPKTPGAVSTDELVKPVTNFYRLDVPLADASADKAHAEGRPGSSPGSAPFAR